MDEPKTEVLKTSGEEIAVRDHRGAVMQQPRGDEPPAAAVAPSYSLVKMAIERDLPIEKLEKLLQLHREEEDRQARRAYVTAMAACKAELQTAIERDRKGDVGKYTTLGLAVDVITPVAAKHGLSFDHVPSQDMQTGRVTVTCRVTHANGHVEEFTMSAMPDAGPRRNAIQAVGSAFNYLRRYTLFGAFGLASAEDDDDGKGAGKTDDHREKGAAAEKLSDRAQKAINSFKRWGIEQQHLEAAGGVGKPATQWGADDFDELGKRYDYISKLAADKREIMAREVFKLPPKTETGKGE